jgi:hypothetical protein
VARNRPPGEPVFGLGSHCDSNRNGGRYDGTLGVVAAIEVCRLERELGLGLPLQVMSFFEEEGSGFGFGLLGSRVMTRRVTEAELRALRGVDDGRPFREQAEAAGHAHGRWRESIHALDTLTGWIELHIEQGRVLQDGGFRVGIVDAITGFVQADLVVRGRADHAGATLMGQRRDPGPVAGACVTASARQWSRRRSRPRSSRRARERRAGPVSLGPRFRRARCTTPPCWPTTWPAPWCSSRAATATVGLSSSDPTPWPGSRRRGAAPRRIVPCVLDLRAILVAAVVLVGLRGKPRPPAVHRPGH